MGLALFIIVNIVVSATAPLPTSAGDLATLMAGGALMNAALLLIPLSIGIAILRHHLFDIDLLINRTLVYLTLTAIVVGTYVFVVGYLSALFRVGNNPVISILAAGCVAVLFAPLRDRLQRGVNRLMYGERDDPYTVLSKLGQRLEATFAPDAVLPIIVETVAQTLKLSYAAITLTAKDSSSSDRDSFTVAAAYGSPPVDPMRLPLVYQTEIVGQLIVAPRPGEMFSAADRQLLANLAHQTGVVAHAVRLTSDLQRARERLVNTREEERRRLRRDLHDDLGPTLASLSQRLDTARKLILRDPKRAGALLGDLKEQFKGTITEIRRLVYALRPPALDELGLVGALREHIAQYDQPHELSVTVEAPNDLPSLPAAVEVAAYYIVLEAFTNVARHSQARNCCIRLSIADGLRLEISDDGNGLPAAYRAGVGHNSMRERAAELGGEYRIEKIATGGMRVWVRLPLPSEEA